MSEKEKEKEEDEFTIKKIQEVKEKYLDDLEKGLVIDPAIGEEQMRVKTKIGKKFKKSKLKP